MLRIAAAIELLSFALVELLRFLALAVDVRGVGPLAGLSGVGLWRRAPWASTAIVLLGVVFATTRLLDALVFGVRPWLFALLAGRSRGAHAFPGLDRRAGSSRTSRRRPRCAR